MSVATSAAPTMIRSSSRRQQSYTAPATDRPHRAPSTTKPPTISHDSRRSDSVTYSNTRVSSTSQQSPLAGVARRDYETTNLARPPSSRRSSSRDGSHAPAPPPYTRNESTRSTRRSTSRPGHTRYNSDMTAPNVGVEATPMAATTLTAQRTQGDVMPSGSSNSAKKRTTIGSSTGQWSLGKTIGAGSMGKVKLAKNLETFEQVAVKIVPRGSTDEHQNARERERADHSKEIRTAREASIVSLLNHPYICAMRDVVRTNHHWYMLFEYVNGGQMLDYIISHGRLKEKQARKFGRQIASALDYCHRNSIVHRDLKIENILISKTGDIKIIDFGLSNLFSPRGHLKTFCGSLYFAAPELLQARQYTGPEVDIWSFGVVLYVLVCGKVPFDDQSMPQLHAKIKRGVADYPQWLSTECRSLISRMLVTDPKLRANLGEIMNHPWITKGFNAPPENYLPHREPLQLPLDTGIVKKMTGFDFGSSEFITRELTKVLDSEDYQTALRLNAKDHAANATGGERRRGVFDFYKRRNSTTSRDTLLNASSEAIQLGSDPMNAFSPLISIYYLVKEKQERERMEANPGALSMPMSPGEMPLKIPDLPAPEPAYTNSTTYEMPGEKVTGGRSRPRSRTHGEDEVTEGVKKLNLDSSRNQTSLATKIFATTDQPGTKRESAAAGLLRRFSTRRGKDTSKVDQPPPSLQIQPPDAAAPRKSFSVRRARNREPSPSTLLHPGGSQSQQPELLGPHTPVEALSKTQGVLGRSISVNSADYRRKPSRRGVSEGQVIAAASTPPSLVTPPLVTPPILTSGSERSSVTAENLSASEAITTPNKSTLNARGSTMRTKSLGHARRESIQVRRARRAEAREDNVPEETDQELATDNRQADSPENMKPVYLKGLFSVSTTSNKSLPVIRADIIRVLRQLGVEYTEIKGGFSCRHAPSIDLKRIIDPSQAGPEMQGIATPPHRRRISFGGFRGTDRSDDQDKSPQMIRNNSRRNGPATSFTNSEDSDDSAGRRRGRGDAPAGETMTHVQSDLGGSMVLRFEVFVVKVPLFSLHGIQFKKVAGGTWQYKNMAQKILDALRL